MVEVPLVFMWHERPIELVPSLCYLSAMKLKQALALSLCAALSLLLLGRYVMAVQASTRDEKQNACAALNPEVLDAPAPPFELAGPTLKQKQSLAALRGKVVLLNFWMTSCQPCIEELPSLIALRRALGGQDFRLLTLSIDDTAVTVQRFFEKNSLDLADLPVLLDPEGKTARAYGTSKVPESYLVDREGRLRLKFVNKRDWSSAAARACMATFL